MAQLNANLTDYESETGFDVLPPGGYHGRVIDSEIKQGEKGPYIPWTYEIVGHPNRVWDIMSLGNEVSMKRLKALAVCAGHPNPNFISCPGKRLKSRWLIPSGHIKRIASMRSSRPAPGAYPGAGCHRCRQDDHYSRLFRKRLITSAAG